MILTVNIHPTAIKVARSGQGGRQVSLEFADASGGSLANIFPGDVEGWDQLIITAIEGRARQVEADDAHAIAADLDEQAAPALPDTEPEPGRDSYSRFYKLIDSDGYDIEVDGFRRFTRSEARQHEADGRGRAVPCRAIDLASIGYAGLTEAADRILYGEAAQAADVDEQIRRDGEALGRRIAADEGLDDDEPPSRVPWPTGFCGHQVPPGAWAAGFTRCRDDISPEHRNLFDEAARQLSAVDDEDGEQR